ncbi:MAG: LysR family transcriptional regulator [Myxococcales bacterium]|nr:LysR family transcriptional regulator [Myxococcales bacterium]MCB9649143.1 LysR family transcriptional regulator [Deltaproteobacteria bacterium]
MQDAYGRDLDLNLLRVFVVVAEEGSVTRAAGRLYLTQPAVSAALGRLNTAIGAPLFVRRGRGLELTPRGATLFDAARPHLRALLEAALDPPGFDPKTSERVVRLGLSDAMEGWLLPPLLRALAEHAPRMRVVVSPVQFRTVLHALTLGRVELAFTVADELPSSIRREPTIGEGFVCLFDPRHVRMPRAPKPADYFAHGHVIVSYNGDLRGVIEDFGLGTRDVRCSVSTFSHIGAIVHGSALVATVPSRIAERERALRPELRTAPLPFETGEGTVDLLWPAALDGDEALTFVREHLARIARATGAKRQRKPR